MAHTRGPWFCDGLQVYQDNANGKTVADCPRTRPLTECHDNAQLIAAAPELLAALEGIMKLIDDGVLVRYTGCDGDPDFAMRQIPLVMVLKSAQLALSKAGGK